MEYSATLLAGVSLLASLLIGCGFQLRGADSTIKLSGTYSVQVKSAYPQLNHIFERTLNRKGFKVVRAAADIVIQIQSEESDSRDHLFDEKFISQRFRRLNYHLKYFISNADGELIDVPGTLHLTSDYHNPTGSYLQQEVARDSALNQLRKNAALEIVNRLLSELAEPPTGADLG